MSLRNVLIAFMVAAGIAPQNCTRRSMFFDRVRAELNTRFEPKDIPRIIRFCEYSNGERNLPSHTISGHEPCEEYIENLSARPWWDSHDFPWVRDLEDNVHVVSQELFTALNNNIQFKGDSRHTQTMGAGWAAIRLQRHGEWTKDSVLFPATVDVIKELNIPVATRGIMFARQLPNSGVAAHSDGRNFILTAHLGLKVPPDCWIEVGGERRAWEERKALILDTSFTHTTANKSDKDRYILIVDFWHPELSEKEQQALTCIYDLTNEFDKGASVTN